MIVLGLNPSFVRRYVLYIEKCDFMRTLELVQLFYVFTLTTGLLEKL
jgi:hypothetical protein